ncbi:GSCOCG00006281001-RA-CDS, partial [Cotesia congregata]
FHVKQQSHLQEFYLLSTDPRLHFHFFSKLLISIGKYNYRLTEQLSKVGMLQLKVHLFHFLILYLHFQTSQKLASLLKKRKKNYRLKNLRV